jgi:hypothetical protein
MPAFAASAAPQPPVRALWDGLVTRLGELLSGVSHPAAARRPPAAPAGAASSGEGAQSDGGGIMDPDGHS